jgi:DNA polymerase IIIc chi subunit
MTERIDFYVLASTAPGQRFRLACRLAAQAYLEHARVIIWSGSDA